MFYLAARTEDLTLGRSQSDSFEGLTGRRKGGNFPGSTVVKAPRYQCRGPGLDPWSGNEIPQACRN